MHVANNVANAMMASVDKEDIDELLESV